MDEDGEAGVGFIVAGGDAAELFEALEEILDEVAPLVHFAVMRNGRLAARHRRDDGDGAPFVQHGAQKGTQNQAIGKSRGGLTTKIVALVDALGNLTRFVLLPGQRTTASVS